MATKDKIDVKVLYMMPSYVCNHKYLDGIIKTFNNAPEGHHLLLSIGAKWDFDDIKWLLSNADASKIECIKQDGNNFRHQLIVEGDARFKYDYLYWMDDDFIFDCDTMLFFRLVNDCIDDDVDLVNFIRLHRNRDDFGTRESYGIPLDVTSPTEEGFLVRRRGFDTMLSLPNVGYSIDDFILSSMMQFRNPRCYRVFSFHLPYHDDTTSDPARSEFKGEDSDVISQHSVDRSFLYLMDNMTFYVLDDYVKLLSFKSPTIHYGEIDGYGIGHFLELPKRWGRSQNRLFLNLQTIYHGLKRKDPNEREKLVDISIQVLKEILPNSRDGAEKLHFLKFYFQDQYKPLLNFWKENLPFDLGMLLEDVYQRDSKYKHLVENY